MAEIQQKHQPRMTPNIPGKIKFFRTFLIGFAFMTCSIFWSYYNVMTPLILAKYLTSFGIIDAQKTIIGFIMTLDNIVALIMLPILGGLSDRTRSKMGKRTPYILIGCISAIITFASFGFIAANPGIAAFSGLILAIMWFNMSMAFFRSAAVAIMPDYTDPKVRSFGNAIVNLMGGISMVLALIVPFVMESIFTDSSLQITGGFVFVSILTGIALIIFLLTIKETPTGDKFLEIGPRGIAIDPTTFEYIGEQEGAPKESLIEGLKRIFTDKDHSGIFMLLVIFTWFFGYNAIDTFYSLYATEYLHFSAGTAGLTLMIAPAISIPFAFVAGFMGDKLGRRKTIFIGLIGFIICLGILGFMKSQLYIMILMALVGCFYIMININTIVILWQIAPKDKIGAYTGAYYLFSQASAILSPLFAGMSIDIFALATDFPAGQEYMILFPFAIVFELLTMLWLSKVKQGDIQQLSKTEVQDLRSNYEQPD